jgi:D-galactose 1-dehydrogenase
LDVTHTDITKIAIVGVGKIARDQHLPSIAKNPSFELAAVVSRNASVEGVDGFASLEELFENRPDIPVVAICTPPQVRFEYAWRALQAGKHVLLEKPPGGTLSEVETLKGLANDKGVTLYATWHSCHATGVEPASDWLSSRKIDRLRIIWKEDVRRWHPNQAWIWDAGNVGVFDTGINALSILTKILPHGIHINSADLEFPSNCETPIAAKLTFTDPMGGDMRAEFDWRHEGHQTWNITVETDEGTLVLSEGGSKMHVNDRLIVEGEDREYDEIYAHFAELLATGQSDVDVAPLRHVADAFMMGRRHLTDAFYE